MFGSGFLDSKSLDALFDILLEATPIFVYRKRQAETWFKRLRRQCDNPPVKRELSITIVLSYPIVGTKALENYVKKTIGVPSSQLDKHQPRRIALQEFHPCSFFCFGKRAETQSAFLYSTSIFLEMVTETVGKTVLYNSGFVKERIV